MYWLIDLKQPGYGVEHLKFNLQESSAKNLTDTQIMLDDPDLSYITTILKQSQTATYSAPIHINDVRAGTLSVETIRNIKHYFLVGDRFEFTGKLETPTKEYFVIRNIMGINTLLTKTFRLGEPFDD